MGSEQSPYEVDNVFHNSPVRTGTPSVTSKPFHQKKTLSIQEDLEQIRKCRYIRKTPRQRAESNLVDLDISFLRDTPASSVVVSGETLEPLKEHNKIGGDVGGKADGTTNQEENLNQEGGDAESKEEKEKVDEVDEKKKEEPQKHLPPVTNPVKRGPVGHHIKPFVLPKKLSVLQRDKVDPLLLADFTSKCNITSPRTNQISTKQQRSTLSKVGVGKIGGNRNLDSLYKDISNAARNADVNLSNVVEVVREEKKQIRQWQQLRKSDESLKRWSYLSGLVRSGWLLGKKGRSLKMMEDRIRKRRLYETNLGTLPVSYQSNLRRSERTVMYANFFQRKLTDSNYRNSATPSHQVLSSSSSVPRVGSRLKRGRVNSLPAVHANRVTVVSRDNSRQSHKELFK